MNRKFLSLLLSTLCGVTLSAAVPEIDEHTLYAGDFEHNTKKADYSVGPANFVGIGALLTPDGYYGKGIDLRGRSIDPEFKKLPECDSPIYNRWGMLTFGNVLPDEGTLEFFVHVDKNTPPRQPNNGTLLNAFVGRFIDDGGSYLGANINLTRKSFSWRFPIWSDSSKDNWSGKVAFKTLSGSDLAPGWHHLALTWAQGEAVIYLDGRVLASCDLSGKYGLSLFHHLNHGMLMGGHIIDCLRISDIARYRGEFEPPWRDGKRPAGAFSGNKEAKRYQAAYRPAPRPVTAAGKRFDFGGLDSELLLTSGVDRQILHGSQIKNTGKNRFEQNFDGKVKVSAVITPGSNGASHLVATFTNTSGEVLPLEMVMDTALPFAAERYFDGVDTRSDLRFARYRNSYPMVLPFAAAAGKDEFAAIGLDPEFAYNDIVHAFIPGKSFQQGTRFVLNPGERFTVKFVGIAGKSRFGTAEALDRYYETFARFYKRLPGSTVYNYLPLTLHWRGNPPADIQRQGFAGGYWGHGPYHTKGDESGFFWGIKKYTDHFSFRHAKKQEKVFGTHEDLRKLIAVENKYEFDNGYGVRRFHICPDLTPEWIMNELAPGYFPKDDPLNGGSYYKRINGNYFVNEYNTVFGKFFREDLDRYLSYGMKELSPGWINDVIYANSILRYCEKATENAPGRSFDRDYPHFVRGAAGKQARWAYINSLTSRGYPMSMISDGGSFSYTMAAYSSQSALESGTVFDSLHGWSFLAYARNLHGEKPLSMHTLMRGMDTGRFITGKGVGADLLRSAFQHNTRQMVIFALEHALLLDPAPYMNGKQYILEHAPLLVEASLRGRKAVSGGEVSGGDYLKRSGSGTDSLLITANRSNSARNAAITLYPEKWDGLPIAVPYFGGTLRSEKIDGNVRFTTTLAPVGIAAYITPAVASDFDAVTAGMSGDGISFQLQMALTNSKSASLRLASFGKLYNIAGITLNGKKIDCTSEIRLPAGENRVTVSYTAAPLKFTDSEWEQLRLFKNGQCNFRIVADQGWQYNRRYVHLPLGFDHGTAAMVEDMVKYYDWSDGIAGNMALPEWKDAVDPAYSGWQFVFKSNAGENSVKLDTDKRLILVSGTTPGELRRVTVVLMRMLDRKYPRIGTIYPLQVGKTILDRKNSWPETKQRMSVLEKFFRNIDDPEFLCKPLLNDDLHYLYHDGVTDFTARVKLLAPPFIVEPTYEDDFVYGYTGEKGEWKEFFEKDPDLIKINQPKKQGEKEMKKTTVAVVTVAAVTAFAAGAPRVDVRSRAEVALEQIAYSDGMGADYAAFKKGTPEEKSFVIYNGRKNLTSKWQKFEISFVPSADGNVQLTFHAPGAKKKENITPIIIDKVEVTGAKLANGSFEKLNANNAPEKWQIRPDTEVISTGGIAVDGSVCLKVKYNTGAARTSIRVTKGQKVTVSFMARSI